MTTRERWVDKLVARPASTTSAFFIFNPILPSLKIPL
jgi:hypothetical protein